MDSRDASSILEHARKSARHTEDFAQGGFHFLCVRDHILESLCKHEESGPAGCSRCSFLSSLRLPELPEMVFPNSRMQISFTKDNDSWIVFNALDALKAVAFDRLPDVQVASSESWQKSRQGLAELHKGGHSFDWTYTTPYAGTLHNCKAVPSSYKMDMNRLMRRDTIAFYSNVTLYEDELADHGSAQYDVRIRVMPDFFFLLARFYLRIDNVLIRICDTRMLGDNGSSTVYREWSRREAKIEQLKHVVCLLSRRLLGHKCTRAKKSCQKPYA